MIPECNHHKDALDDLLKDQFIFGITVKEIPGSLLRTIALDNSIEVTKKLNLKLNEESYLVLKQMQATMQ